MAITIPVPLSCLSPCFAVLAFVASTISIGYLLLLITGWLATRPVPDHQEQQPSVIFCWIAYALPCALIWTAYLLAFWPGIMSSDSVDQWGQMLTGHFNNNHPAFHTLTNWLFTRVWLSPAAVAMAQILALASVFGLTMRELALWGVPRNIRIVITMLFSLSPVNGLMTITLWKDVPYAISMLGLFALLMQCVRTRWDCLSSSLSKYPVYATCFSRGN
ncbi:MAG: DUF6020 family protein, partial [Verrucomicrobiota bacterium]